MYYINQKNKKYSTFKQNKILSLNFKQFKDGPNLKFSHIN